MIKTTNQNNINSDADTIVKAISNLHLPYDPDEMSSDAEKCAKSGMEMIKKEGDKK